MDLAVKCCVETTRSRALESQAALANWPRPKGFDRSSSSSDMSHRSKAVRAGGHGVTGEREKLAGILLEKVRRREEGLMVSVLWKNIRWLMSRYR